MVRVRVRRSSGRLL